MGPADDVPEPEDDDQDAGQPRQAAAPPRVRVERFAPSHDPGEWTYPNMWAIISTPRAFFGHQRGHTALGPPTLFLALTLLAALVIELVWGCAMSMGALVLAALSTPICVFLAVMVPFVMAGVLAVSAVLHGCVRILGCRSPFGLTYRAVVYSMFPAMVISMVQQLLAAIGPYAAPVIVLLGLASTVWGLGLLFVGLRTVHDLTTAQSAGSIVLSVVVFGALTAAAVYLSNTAGVPVHLRLFGVDVGEIGK